MTTNTTETTQVITQETIIAEAKAFAEEFLGKVGSIPNYRGKQYKGRLTEVQVRETKDGTYIFALYEINSTMPEGAVPFDTNISYLHKQEDDIDIFPEAAPSQKKEEMGILFVLDKHWQWEGEAPQTCTESGVNLLFKQVWSNKTIMESNKNPTEEEVLELLKQHTSFTNFNIKQSCSDSNGLYLLDLESVGGTTKYSYARRGQFPESRTTTTTISFINYDTDGVPQGGGTLADYIDNQWKINIK